MIERLRLEPLFFGEVSRGRGEDAAELKILLADCLVDLKGASLAGTKGAGEEETLNLYRRGLADFVLIDDGAAARHCKREGIPFINSLLVPSVLLYSGYLSRDRRNRYMAELGAIGFYSDRIRELAMLHTAVDLHHFLPD